MQSFEIERAAYKVSRITPGNTRVEIESNTNNGSSAPTRAEAVGPLPLFPDRHIPSSILAQYCLEYAYRKTDGLAMA